MCKRSQNVRRKYNLLYDQDFKAANLETDNIFIVLKKDRARVGAVG
jgi:hypothetical protein